MSKKSYLRATRLNRVQAEYARFKRDERGELTNTKLYNIFGPEYLKR